MTTKEYYNKHVKPFAFDDTIKYEDLNWWDKLYMWYIKD